MPNNHTRILITGATGFVGTHLCAYLRGQNFHVKTAGKNSACDFVINNIDGTTDWQESLTGIHIVIHLAARVHHQDEKGLSALPLYQDTNVKGTQRLVKAAIAAGVKRFIYLSSVKVIAEKSMSYPLRAQEQPRPLDAYGLSKLQAERILQEEARRSSMEWVIIRPPLIYGAFVKGNFRRLMQLARLPLPLPLASINNKRSLLSIDNLNSFIATCLYHPNAHGQVFLVSDNQDVSTPKLLALLRQQLGKKPYLIPFPLSVIKLMAWLCGRSAEINRLTESLQVNIEQSMRLLQWQPPYTLEESLQALYHRELGRD